MLPEIKIIASTYKYLNAVNNKEMAQPVKLLERQAATFDVKNSEYYQDDYETYFISFYIPDGSILTAYDSSGKLLRIAEKFKSTKLPPPISQAVAARFPQWTIAKDAYLVDYLEPKTAKKVFKLLLENGDKQLRVTLNAKGEFI
jgi:hypothetical protein